MVGSSTTCCEEWLLTEDKPGPLPRPGLRLTGVFVGVIVVGLLLGWLLRSGETEVAAVGSPAPDFTVPLISGGTFTLSEHDSVVVVNQWASWCIPCRTEIPEISAFADANPDVTVVGVAVEDTPDAARDFAREVMASYDLGLGNVEFESAYPRLGLPVTYVIDERGRVSDIVNGIVTREALEELTSS